MHVVIVGGGFAGVKAALELSNKKDLSVTLISRGSDFEYHGALYRSATGHSPLEVVMRLGDIFAGKDNIELVVDNIDTINNQLKYVKSETGQQYPYDRLLMCVGNEKSYFGIPGLDVYAHSMYTIHDTMKLRNELVKLFTIPHRQKVRVIVIGAGPSGTELASELQNFSNLVANRYGHTAKKVEVDLVERSARVLPILNEKASRIALKRLVKIGVNVMLGKKVIQCTRNTVRLDDEERAADLIIWTAGCKTVDIYSRYPELFAIEQGRVVVNEYMQVNKAKDIYVLGDNAFTKYSGMAQTAVSDAIFVAKNLISEVAGKELRTYAPHVPIYVVPISGKWAVVQSGNSVRSGRYGWTVRRKADLYIYKNFEPLKKAYITWRKGNRLGKF